MRAHPRGRQRGQVGVKPRRLPCRNHGGSSRVAVATDGWVGGRPSAGPLRGVLGRHGEWTSQEQGNGEERFRVNGLVPTITPF